MMTHALLSVLYLSTEAEKQTCKLENELFFIECHDGSMVKIISALYKASIGHDSASCPGQYSLPNAFYELCASKRSCEFNISTISIENVCQQQDILGLESHLEISYFCEGNYISLYCIVKK